MYDIPVRAIDGEPVDASALRGRATLIVNVASRCGFTPQYAGLERLHERYRERGFTVLGVPCNQFGEQEPGSADEIAAFCSATYAVRFPLTEKLDVNGHRRHPLFQALTAQPDGAGRAGDVRWNFEKFLVSPRGEPLARFRSNVDPETEEIVAAIESALPSRPKPAWSTRSATEVLPGDRVRAASGVELTVTRIEASFLDRTDMICLIEDTPARWLSQPIKVSSTVHVLVG